MGLLDSIVSAVGGGNGGKQAALLPALLEQVRNYPGGLPGLIERFREGGLSEVVASWIGTGPNQPVSGDQLESVLGQDMIGSLSSQSGLDKGSVLAQLTSLLPALVDHATPNGEADAATKLDDNLLGSLSGLLGKL
jgi:uncharacterized protein YidB (DUF937 family)